MGAKELFLSWGMLILSVVFNAIGVFILKIRLNELGPIKLDSMQVVINYCILLFKSGLVIAGAFLFCLAPFLFAVSLSRMEISVAYPVQVALNFIILIMLAVVFLGESLTLNKGMAIAFAFISIFLLYKK